jgi:molybdate transport system substrate-binding protein
MVKLAAILLAIVAALTASGAAAAGKITVFAAASLTNALQDIDAAYTKRTGSAVAESFASSSTLARQIEAGAPAQIFISADTKWMDYLAARGLIATRTALLGNALVLVAPADSPVAPRGIDSDFDWLKLLGSDGHLAVGDPDHVPAGIYAKDALQHLGAWQTLEPHLARADDVRAALTMVERGDTPLGIVYVTDARVSSKVKIVGVFPASSHAPIIYPAAIVKGADTPPADDYFRFLHGTEAHAIFARYGFATP